MPQGVEQDQPGLSSSPRRVVVLGSTGSVGRSALSVLAHENLTRLQLLGLAANARWQPLLDQARTHRPRYVALADPAAASALRDALKGSGIDVLVGPEGIERLVSLPETDRVVSAIVGAAGLRGTYAALDAGKTVALANKETLVMAGPLVTDLARRRAAELLPVDSEHSAIFQALHSGKNSEVRRVILTSSGGPFRGRSRAQLANVTREQALDHPTWKMGPKISVDSATLMNKALEVIEARWLFDLQPHQIQVVIHPQSIVHSMVEFVDGSTIAQLSPPDMRLPVQYALTYPDRLPGPCPMLDLTQRMTLHFEPPDLDTFPALQLGFDVIRAGGTAGAALNAANEAAVARFLDGSLRFLDIPRACKAALESHPFDPNPSLDQIWKVDAWARQEVGRWNS